MELPAHLELASAWREIKAELRRVVGESTYEIWLAPLEVKAWDGAVLLLQAPPSTQAWVAKRFGGVLENCARGVVGSAAKVSFTGTGGGGGARPAASAGGQRRSSAAEDPNTASGSGLNPRYNFDQFIIGDGNRLAHAAALAVAELPGQAYNPLFLHAAPGQGKTHLLHAIGNYVLAFGGGASVRYTTVEAFTNHFITALGTRSLDRFKRAYRDADVLLIDDVQFLASKAKTEEEFFHTFNALYENGRQLVLTCDRLPRQLVGVEARLRERFESGLVADIAPPDFATRIAILRKRAALDAIGISDLSVLELIAERVTDNVRALEGALIRIVAHHSLTNQPINVALATTVLDGMYPQLANGGASIERIRSAVAVYYDVTVQELLSPSRAARISWPRQIAIHLSRELTTESLQAIGAAFGGRNHATVLHACKRVSQRMMETPETTNDIRELTTSLTRGEADRDY